jgi:4-amino-4-deoxy-L-arabinose transferase-like glycosyltransferase
LIELSWDQERRERTADGSLGRMRLLCLVILAALVLLPGLGSSGRLTYHEAFVAQGAREILSSGNWGYPTIGDLPWLEKPPLPWWLVAVLGYCTGTVNETVARFPSALAATGLIIGIGVLAARHYGPGIGVLAGAVQATTAWTVVRGRLAEADILLTCLIVWAIVAFDGLLSNQVSESTSSIHVLRKYRCRCRWAFLIFLGTSALVKGIGFGVVLILTVAAGILVWQRDRSALRRLWVPGGWTLAAILALAWPLFMVAQHGQAALSLWMTHIWARVVRQEGPGPFAGESWGEYIAALLTQALPWTPLVLAGAWQSLSRALGCSQGWGCLPFGRVPARVVAGDRLLWVWAVIPLTLLSLVPVKNAHYAISAQAPWSIWVALGLARIGTWLDMQGYNRRAILAAARLGFTGLALAYGLGLWMFGPWFSRRGVEWAFYEAVGQRVPTDMGLALLYDDWDRNPYLTPFGSIPHDLAVRLFYLSRSACWHIGPTLSRPTGHILGRCSASAFVPQPRLADSRTALSCGVGDQVTTARDGRFAVIGRDRDLPVLKQLGDVNVVFRGPNVRYDRTYVLFHVIPRPDDGHFAVGLGIQGRDSQVTR